MEIIVKNAYLLINNSIVKKDLYIRNGRIEKIGPIKEKPDLILERDHHLVIPSFYNMHTHLPMSLLKGYEDEQDLHNWLQAIWKIEDSFSKEDIYIGTMLALAESIHSGVSFVNDMYFFADSIAKAIDKSGLRALVGRGLTDNSKDIAFKELDLLLNKYSNHNRISISVAPHAVYTCSKQTLLEAKEYAINNNLFIHMHVAETREEVYNLLKQTGKRPFEYLDDLGLLSNKFIAAHASWASIKEIELAGKRGITIAHCPVSNLKLSTGGIAPITKYLQHNAVITFGTDGSASNNSLSMQETAKCATLLQNHYFWKHIFKAQQAFDALTRNPSSLFGINNSIKEGNVADLSIIPITSSLAPLNDIYSNLIYSSYQVRDLIVDGSIIMQDYSIRTFDEQEIIKKAEKIKQRFKRLE